VTCYRLDGPGIESQWGRDILHLSKRYSAPVQTGSEAHSASYAVGTGSFPGVKWPGCGVDHQPPCSAEVKKRVEPYLHSPSGPSWLVLE